MALSAGHRLGVFEIVEKVGAGGMGEVFRAIDTNLQRIVAIKVLPSSLAQDPERLARFEREAHTLAALNHPNIAQLYGFEKGSTPALVMEFVDGDTLAERIAAGPVPIDEALTIALRIAEALESAHDLGIVHRDLKPANIKVREDGAVKVLDFGLAKSIAPDPASTTLANSPTITTPAMTHAGVVLGTAAYMSPEQAKGKAVDRRTDVWAFGCVLFEMLTGRRAFGGEDVGDVMVSILRDDPNWNLLPAATPAHVRTLLRRCLTRDARQRLPHIAVARLDLAEPPPPAGSTSGGQKFLIAGAAAALVLTIGITSAALWPRASTVDANRIQLRFELGTNRPIEIAGAVAISPDEATVVFAGRSAGDNKATVSLFVRRLDTLDARQLEGTEGATTPFFSPDGGEIGFFSRGQLRRVPVWGGRVETVCDAPVTRGGWWADDQIYFASDAGLLKVRASGGTPEAIYTADPGGATPAFPQVLPGATHIIYSEAIVSGPSSGVIVARRLADGQTRQLTQGRFARYLSSGYLTYFRGNTMYAVRFDPATLEQRGDPESIAGGVARVGIGAMPIVAAAGTTVLYSEGGIRFGDEPAPMMWLSQTGPLTPLIAAPSLWFFPRFSPDGTRIAMSVADDHGSDVWVYDIARDVTTRVTNEPGSDVAPLWTPDGTGLVFASSRGTTHGLVNLFWQRADGTGDARRLTTGTTPQIPGGFDAHGRRLVFHQGDPAGGRQSIAMLNVDPGPDGLRGGAITELVGGPFLSSNPRISPDGRWLAYAATTGTGSFELFVQSLSPGAPRVQISSGGAALPAWSPTSNELYFSDDRSIKVVAYSVKDGKFVPEKQRPWTSTPFSAVPPFAGYGPGVDLHPDGSRFVVAPPAAAATSTGATRSGQLVLMLNAFGR